MWVWQKRRGRISRYESWSKETRAEEPIEDDLTRDEGFQPALDNEEGDAEAAVPESKLTSDSLAEGSSSSGCF